MSIQWFPGHMTKTKKLIRENLKKVDVVIELLDARAPLASRNPLLEELTGTKPHLILLGKLDLADPHVTREWMKTLEQEAPVRVLGVNSRNRATLKEVPKACKALCKGRAWLGRRPIRAMIVGIPNVGKSTIINTLGGKRKALVEDRPGLTRQAQRVILSRDLQVLDTPGLLWHKFDDPLVGLKLACLGSIKDQILPLEEIAAEVLDYLCRVYPQTLQKRYGVGGKPQNGAELLQAVGEARGLLTKGGLVDHLRTARMVLKELRGGDIGRISLEAPAAPAANWFFNRSVQEGLQSPIYPPLCEP